MTVHEAMHGYAALGWPVFPVHGVRGDGRCNCGDATCKHPGKHPLVEGGFKSASVEATRIDEWAACFPDCNVGIATGTASGLVVIDIDPRNGGDASFDALVDELGAPPVTLESLTGGGGRHLLFKHPGTEVRCKSGVRPGIDVKADGGYIVAPPSRHESGKVYAWELATADLEPTPVIHGCVRC